MEIVIRRASVWDTAVIIDFNRKLAEESENKHLIKEHITEGVRTLLAHSEYGEYFLACAPDNTVVGQIMYTPEWSDWRNAFVWWVQSVYVRPDYRRLGVFSKLFEHLKEEAIRQKVTCLKLYVDNDNVLGQQAYLGVGMVMGGYSTMQLHLLNKLQEPE